MKNKKPFKIKDILKIIDYKNDNRKRLFYYFLSRIIGVAGVSLAAYVGIYMFLFKGIVDILSALPLALTSGSYLIALGIVKIIFWKRIYECILDITERSYIKYNYFAKK